VELMGSPDLDVDYYKIKPPADAYLWLSMDYVKLLGPPAPQKPIEVPAPQPAQPAEKPAPEKPAETPTQPAEKPAEKPEAPTTTPPPAPVKPAQPSVESLGLQKCYQIAEAMEQELKKPLPAQNYTEMKQTLSQILETPEAGKAEAYAKLLLAQINSYELASQVQKELAQQDRALDEIRNKIAKAHEVQREKAVPTEAKYLFVVTLKPSHVDTGRVGPKRYLVVDKNKRILCYLLPKDPSLQAKLDGLADQIVGIRGTVLDDPKAMLPVVLLSEAEAIFED